MLAKLPNLLQRKRRRANIGCVRTDQHLRAGSDQGFNPLADHFRSSVRLCGVGGKDVVGDPSLFCHFVDWTKRSVVIHIRKQNVCPLVQKPLQCIVERHCSVHGKDHALRRRNAKQPCSRFTALVDPFSRPQGKQMRASSRISAFHTHTFFLCGNHAQRLWKACGGIVQIDHAPPSSRRPPRTPDSRRILCTFHSS